MATTKAKDETLVISTMIPSLELWVNSRNVHDSSKSRAEPPAYDLLIGLLVTMVERPGSLFLPDCGF